MQLERRIQVMVGWADNQAAQAVDAFVDETKGRRMKLASSRQYFGAVCKVNPHEHIAIVVAATDQKLETINTQKIEQFYVLGFR